MTKPPRPPHENSYWLPLPPAMIVAGEYAGDVDPRRAREKIGAILDAGITLLLDLTEEGELWPYDAVLAEEAARREMVVEHLRLPIRDMDVCARPEMEAIMRALHDAMRAGTKVYLHCFGGIGRTGTVVGCWLVEQGMAGDEALAIVGALFRTMSPEKLAWHPEGSPQTPEQRAMVREWSAGSKR